MDRALDAAVNWLDAHPRIACAFICLLWLSASLADGLLP